jgi:hypothetical protein
MPPIPVGRRTDRLPQPRDRPELGDLDGAEAAADGGGDLRAGEAGQPQLHDLPLVRRQPRQQRPDRAGRLVVEHLLLR